MCEQGLCNETATKEEQAAALKVIVAAAVDMEVVRSKACGDIYILKCNYIYFEFLCTLYLNL